MTLLEVEGLTGGYGPVRVLHGIDLAIDEGEIGVILGANGAGKTTTLRALSGMIRSGGRVRLDGMDIRGLSVERIAAAGVAHVPQGRGTFGDLTVEENLRIGGMLRRDGNVDREIARWYEVFPRLGERRNQQAAGMSGGEQQMLAIARALMFGPRLVLLDEPSLGLAPNTTRDLFATLAQINAETNVTMLVVEQNAHLALAIANKALVLESGRIVARGTAEEMQNNTEIQRAYLGYQET